MIAITRAAVTRFPYPILTIVGAAATLRSRISRSRTGRSPALRSFADGLLNVLDLLTNTLEFRLQFDHVLCQRRIVRLGTHSIRLPAEFLE